MSDALCPRCGLWVPDNQAAAYRGWHEDCVPYADPKIAALRDGVMRRINREALERLASMPERGRGEQ